MMNRKECPFCGEMIQDGALKCRYCREWLDKEAEPISIETEEETKDPSEIDQKLEAKIETFLEQGATTQDEEPKTATPKKSKKAEPLVLIEIEEHPQPQEELTSEIEVKEDIVVDEIVLEELTPSTLELEEKNEEEPETLPLVEEKQEEEPLPPPIVEEEKEEVFVPVSPTPSPSSIFYEEEGEELEEKYKIGWQNFKTNKIISIITFIVGLFALYYFYAEMKTEFTIRSAASMLLMFALNTYLVQQLYVYVRNFDIYEKLQTTLKLLVGTYALSCASIVLFFVAYHYANTILIILPIICITLMAILRLIVGWNLWKKTYDYVGGLEGVGAVTLFSVLLPGLGLMTPLVYFKVFSDAEEHVEDNGYMEENELGF